MTDFEIFAKMAQDNLDIAAYPTVVEAKKAKGGAHVTMGTHEQCINQVASSVFGKPTHYFMLYVINKEQYDSIAKIVKK